MKLKTFIWIFLLPMLLLCSSCKGNDPDDIKGDSTDLLTLAESVLGQKESAAVQILKNAKMKADADSANTYVRERTTYIKLSLAEGRVQAVELGKDHASMTDAIVTEKVWSKYTEDEALTDYVLWTGITVAAGDTLLYMKGSLVESLKGVLAMVGSYIPSGILSAITDGMNRDNRSFQLAIYELDPQTIDAIGEVAYKTEVDLSNPMNLMGLVSSGIDAESASCRLEEISTKSATFRVTYTHALKEHLNLSALF